LRDRALFRNVAARVVAGLLRLFAVTWRVREEGSSPFPVSTPFVGASWHRNLLMAAVVFRSPRVAVPVSRSHDGELTAAVLARLGFAPSPRGSSSRGAASLLRGMIRCIRQGVVVGILADGPRGPARQAKRGAVALARATGRPIHPVGISAHPCIRFHSWDRAILPLPFAKVRVAYGEPIHVPKNTRAEDLEQAALGLTRELNRLTDRLDASLGLEES
jgi:lysophospholipid acyltransferase (LPLAT)-like uncharacterized protein